MYISQSYLFMLPLQVVPRQHIRNVAALKKDDLATLDMMLEVSHRMASSLFTTYFAGYSDIC